MGKAVSVALVLVGLVTLPLIDRLSDTDRPVDALAAALVILAGAVTALRTRWPVATLLATAAIVSAYLVTGYSFGPILLSPAVAVYTVARSRPRRTAAIWSAVALAVLLLHLTTGGPLAGIVPGTAWVAVPFALGLARRLVSEAQQRERAETERRIVDAERLRIAQEVHDVVGHGLAAIQMQAEIALHLRQSKPEQADAALTAISAASAEALTELRATLAAGPLAPAPGLDRAGRLCERVRATGVAVDLTVSGRERPLRHAADLTAYRVLQEALTNVVRHSAHPRAEVTIDHQPRAVELRVRNQALDVEHADGLGIGGMRRRVEQLGGTLTAGPGTNGHFTVRATIPRDAT